MVENGEGRMGDGREGSPAPGRRNPWRRNRSLQTRFQPPRRPSQGTRAASLPAPPKALPPSLCPRRRQSRLTEAHAVGRMAVARRFLSLFSCPVPLFSRGWAAGAGMLRRRRRQIRCGNGRICLLPSWIWRRRTHCTRGGDKKLAACMTHGGACWRRNCLVTAVAADYSAAGARSKQATMGS